jgi:hypothetical protein
VLTNCTVVGNTAGVFGGGLCNISSDIIVKNSILWANTAANESQGPQIALVEPFFGMSVSISHSDVQGGEIAVYDPCDDLVWGEGNIDADPYFALFDIDGDPNMWDFHLQSADGRWDPNVQNWVMDFDVSPCIDTGEPNANWTEEPWPNGKRINIGAYGGTSQASRNGNIADFDVSRAVDFTDFALFAGKWKFESDCVEDLNGNGVVDLADLGIFAENWLWQKYDNVADFDMSGAVDFVDFALFTAKWNFEGDCVEDLNGNGVVDLADLGIFAENWLWQKE